MLKSIIVSSAFVLGLSAASYSLDATHSSVGFGIKHMGISTVKGEFKEFMGSYVLDDTTGALKELKGDVVVKSLTTGVEKRDGHLLSADFFDAAQYPKISFAMTQNKMKGKNGKILGTMTMHGVSKPIELVATVAGPAVDPWGTKKSAVSLKGVINREDFGLKWNKTLEAGGFLVGKDVTLTIELEGNGQ